MQQIKFANVLLEENPRAINYPSLFCRATAPVFRDRASDEWRLYGPGEFDFTTYFNALSIAKLERYTSAKAYHLHLELKGAACTVRQTAARTFDTSPRAVKGKTFELAASSDWQTLDFELGVDPLDTLSGFIIEAQGELSIANSYYSFDVDEDDIRPIELALSTTTFKKEDYIIRNIELIRKDILAGDPEMAAHFTMIVVDNGRTLDAEGLSGDGVMVLPNPNAGGAGGFARGMIEAQRLSTPATHVLLMDDDVAVSPESIKRTYQLLRVLKPEWQDSFISGAMLNYDVCDWMWEDLGYMTPEGRFSGVKPTCWRMNVLNEIVRSEQFEPTEEQKRQMYAAWWYCVIPTDTIKRCGLPLPVFVRCDDAEYGIRCKPKFITMNGICIWHMAFHSRYNAAVERYQTTRNTLIAQATTGMAPDSDFLEELHGNMQIELKKFNYTDAELLLDGFEDFMKGPDFIGQPVAEECFMRANRNAEKLKPLDELREDLAELGIDIDKLNTDKVYRDKPRSKSEALVDFITFNRQRVMKSTDGGVAVMPAEGWMYYPGKVRGKETVVAIDVYRQRGAIRHRDVEHFDRIMKRYHDDLNAYHKNKDKLDAAYAAAREKLISEDFWKGYLGID